MKFPITHKKQTASLKIVGLLLAIAPLWLMLATANTSAYAQTSNDVSNSSTTTSPSPADWTEFHRDNMQRWNPYETVLGVGNVGALQVKWKNSLGLYGQDPESSPSVVSGVVYFGSVDHNIYALSASTGGKLWSFATGNQIASSPAVVNGAVYIGSEDGNLYALNAVTGAELWSYTGGAAIPSSPAVANGVVYFGSDDFNVYALNATTGAKRWSFKTGSSVFSSPAIANGLVYVGSADNNVYALNASSGALVWKFNTNETVTSSPAVVNGVVYIGSGFGNVYALNANTGAKLWSFFTGNFVDRSPAVANGVVYFTSVVPNGGSGNLAELDALNASTGAKLWSYRTGGSGGVVSSPAVANGVVYIGSALSNGVSVNVAEIDALNASTGTKLWIYTLKSTIASSYGGVSSPTIVDGVLYIRAGDFSGGNVYAYALGSADLFLRIRPTTTTVHQGDLLTYAFPVWNLGPDNAYLEVLNTQVPTGTTFDYIRISGTPGLGTCTHPPYQGTGQIVCHENSSMAPNTTWTVRLTVKVTAPAGTVITENAATLEDTPDPNMANNTATVSIKVQ
jgi:outer membrane protein assembly factor BamB